MSIIQFPFENLNHSQTVSIKQKNNYVMIYKFWGIRKI